MKSTIILFKAVPIKSKRKKKASKHLLETTIKRGFIFAPEVVSNYSENELLSLMSIVEEEIGLTPEKMNSTFHKSWAKVRDSSIFQLVVEQLIHYFTTYGFEALGIYDKDSVYIPNEKLEIPKLEGGINLVIIKGYTKKELKEKLLSLLKSGIALGEDTISNIIDVATFVEITEKEIDKIRNKEVKIALYDYLGLFPEHPIEFLRYIIYKATGKTLLIKSPEAIEAIKDNDNLDILGLFVKYKKKHGLEKLAEIFYRFKPIFLALKGNTRLNSMINKIRKLARKYHKPMEEDYLNEVTAKIQNKRDIYQKKLKEELLKANTFRKIRLAYALKYRTKDVESILYRIRNGKGYAKEFRFTEHNRAKRVLDSVLDSIVKDVSKNVKGKKIYIPDYINYTLPATEKQFTGDLPSGSYVSIPKDMVFGIHWENTDGHRIDLDLSIMNAATKIGWDSTYRSEDKKILFSGDITDAPKPKGASELFYIRQQILSSYILFVNYYNFDKDSVEVPFKILVAKEQVKNLKQNYMVDPNNVMCVAKTKINQRQKILGLVVTTTNECRFYFTECYLGRSITSSGSEFVEHSRQYLFDFYRNTISLNDILVKAGGKLVKDRDKCDIDLSPEVLEKDTIINLIKN